MTAIFSPEVWTTWETSGKDEVTKKIEEIIEEDGEDACLTKCSQSADLTTVLHEVLYATVKGKLRRDYSVQFLKDVLTMHPDIPSQLVEIMALIELEVASPERANPERDILVGLVRAIPLEKLYKERLDFDILGDGGIVKVKKNFVTKTVKLRTKMYYKQQKFNLLREESEGYAKLITELNQDITSEITPHSIIQVIQSLIGSFNLDPNRVLDLILEAFECRPDEHSFYIGLIHLFPHEPAAISEIVGFKINHTDLGKEEGKRVYVLIALLLRFKILSLEDVYDWLTPEDSSMAENHENDITEAKELERKSNVVSTKDKELEKGKEREEEELRAKAERAVIAQYETNQKIQLAVALLEVGNWEVFMNLCSRFPEFYLVSCTPVSLALINLVKALTEPLYRELLAGRTDILPSRIRPAVLPPPSRVLPSPIKSYLEMQETVFPMLTVLGPYISKDLGVMYTILRLAKEAMKLSKQADGERSKFYYEFISVLDECILPAVSMFDANPCIAEEVWQIMKEYPYEHRYKLYGRWKNETYRPHPYLVKTRTNLVKKAKYTMMRLTKETVKPCSRTIAKMTHNMPGNMFEYILKQVQLYDNLINPVVDSFKYLTSLSYDVLGYVIVEFLSTCKDRTGQDAMGISPWFQSLSGFCGTLCKKYTIEMGGILQFVANQLKNKSSLDLLLLKDILQKMGGADSLEDLKAEQIAALCGGDVLKREAGQYVQEKNTKRSSQRLKDALLENELTIPMLLLMAQQRSSIIYTQTESQHLKLVGKLYDQCQETMVQFGSYMNQIVSLEELNKLLPPIGDLLTEYHVNADVAFFLTRPLLGHLLTGKYEELCRKDKEKKATPEGRLELFVNAFHSVLDPAVEAIKPHYSSKVWEDMNPQFFLTFWILSISDLDVPVEAYDKEIKKLLDTPAPKVSRKKDMEKLQSLKEKLEEEKKKQLEHKDRILSWLDLEKTKWFKQRTARSPKNDTVTTFLQLCMFPRCTFTTLDAMYCSKFIHLLHVLKTPNFSTLLCYDRMYCDITYTVTSCTELEAHHYARFLLGTLETVMHWHSKEEHFENECARYPGFITRYRVSHQEANDYVDYENYRHVVHKWHYKITKALVTCLESGDYIQIRNAIYVLQGIMNCFPAIVNLAAVIEKRIERVKATERGNRNDLYVLANSYSGRLKAKKPQLVPESCFHIVKKVEPAAAARPSPAVTPAVNGLNGDSNVDKSKKVREGSEKKDEIVNGDIDTKKTPLKDGIRDDIKRKTASENDDSDIPEKKLKLSDEKLAKAKPKIEDDGVVAVDDDDSDSEVKIDSLDKEARISKRRKVEKESKSSRGSSDEKTKRSGSHSSDNSKDKKEKRSKKRSISPDASARKARKTRAH